MRSQALVFAMDLAVKTGVAIGMPDMPMPPESFSVTLKCRDEAADIAFGNMIAFLSKQWSEQLPDLVAIEAPFSLQAFKDHRNAEATVLMAYGLHAIVRGMCRRFGIRCEQGHAATIRKHFLGRARFGGRAEAKAAVIARCHLLKLMPASSVDDNRADALATWDWACAHFCSGSASTRELHLFGEEARA